LYIVLFWRLGLPTFWDPDEAHYAETTRELIRTGIWSTPYYNDAPFFDKPIFFHLAQAVPMAILGSPELGARLVPALAGLALVGITAWLGATLISVDVGLVAALLLATSPGIFALARYAILDTLFTAFLFGGVSLVVVAALTDRPARQWAGYVLIGFAVLVKGPLAIVLSGLACILSSVASSDARRRLLRLHWIAGLAIVVCMTLPWYLYMWRTYQDAFLEGYVLNENIRLFARPMYARQPGAWFYFRILASGLLPWTGLLIGRLVDDIRRTIRGTPPDTAEILLWAWTVAVVGFFSSSAFKLDHYVFPAAPSLCLLCARAYTDVRRAPLDPANSASRAGLHLVGPLLVAVGTGIGYFIIARLQLPPAAIVVPVALTAAGAFITIRANLWQYSPPRVPRVALAAIAVTYAGIVFWVLPALEHRKIVPDLARWVAAQAQPADRIATYRLNRWNTAFRFYVDRHTEPLETPAEARAFFERPEPFYCAMLAPAFDEFVAQGVPLRVVYEREGMWATSGRALWRRRVPATQFVVVTRAP
jgi:4-amino-4-deoxy-L-arabinose transferase-like glycosyltransferase